MKWKLLSNNRICNDRNIDIDVLTTLLVTKYKALVIFILLVNTCVYGLAKGQNEFDTIRITYGYYNGGYGIYRSTACYAFHKKAYKLQLEKSDNVHNASQLPKTISKESVSKLLNDCNLYATEDRSEFIKVTKDDYSSFIKIINDKDSLDNYLPFLYDFKKEQYELEEDAFMSLSRNDIVNIIESPNTSPNSFYLVHSKPILIIELTSNNGGSITIEPQWYFYDTAWKVLSQGKERYVGYEYIMAFLKDIQYDKYPFFWERFYLLFQIADAIKEKRAKVAMEKRSALPSAAISSTVRKPIQPLSSTT